MKDIFKKIWRFYRRKTQPDFDIQQIIIGGGKIGDNVHFTNCTLDLLAPWLISIGDNVTLSLTTLLTHDASTKKRFGYTKFGKVTIGSNVFVGAGSVILPGVEIGDNVVIGAGSVVSRDIPSNSVAVGAPCHPIGNYDSYMAKCESMLNAQPHIDKWPLTLLTNEERTEVLKHLEKERYFFLR